MKEWVAAVHSNLVEEFDRLRKLGVKFNWKTLQAMTLLLIENGSSPLYNRHTIDSQRNMLISQCITRRWVQNFADRHRIVSRSLTGKLLLSPEKEARIHKEVAFYLGEIERAFCSEELHEDDVENADETHFVINVENGKTLVFAGDQVVKWADVVSGGEGMTLVVRISGGRVAKIMPAFMVFRNDSRSYPIRGVPDDVDGVSHRSGPKKGMDTTVMPQWLSERKFIKALSNERKRILYLDNCSVHNLTPVLEEAAEKINTTLRYFPKNATHLIQPADSFVIQKIKSAWTARWEKYTMQMILSGKWGSGGKLLNPEKSYFLKLAALAIANVNPQQDSDVLSYARKAMIRTGMAMNLN